MIKFSRLLRLSYVLRYGKEVDGEENVRIRFMGI